MSSESIITIPKKDIFIRLLFIVCFGLFFIDASLIYKHTVYHDSVYEASKQKLEALTVNAAQEINNVLLEAMAAATTLADKLSDEKQDGTYNIHLALKEMLSNNGKIYGGTITYKPFAYQPERKLYSIYYSHSGNDDDLVFLQLDQLYDYTDAKYDWYVEPMKQGSRWGEPYWDEAGKTYMITYSAVFYHTNTTTKKKIPTGVVTVDLSMAEIKNIIESLDFGSSGFGGLTTRQGNYLYHPNDSYVKDHKSLLDIAREKNDADRLKMAKAVLHDGHGIINHTSTTTGEQSWLMYEPIPVSGWSLQNTFIKNSIKIDRNELRHQKVSIILVSILFLIHTLALFLIAQGLTTERRLWLLALTSSVLIAIGIGLIWSLALSYYSEKNNSGTQISDKRTLHSFITQHTAQSLEKSLAKPIYIPTGINIVSIDFSDANTISISGKIWQKYPIEFQSSWAKAFEIASAKSQTITLLDNQMTKNGRLIHWRFQAELRIQPNYSRYPLEVEHVSIQLLPMEREQNIVLIPDLDAYKLVAPTLLPGLSKDVFIPGWELTDTFFMLKHNDRKTNFGIKNNFDQQDRPDLYYVIGIKRIVIDAFISNLTPLIVVAIILFSIGFVPSNVDISRILGICISVFFVVVFAHLAIRKSLSIGTVFYLEYFFFVIYFSILIAPMRAFFATLKLDNAFFSYRDGLFPKLLFWPVLLVVFLFVTAKKFY